MLEKVAVRHFFKLYGLISAGFMAYPIPVSTYSFTKLKKNLSTAEL